MPVYEFYCNQCRESFEAQQHIEQQAREIPPCPACQSAEHVKRQVSLFHAQTSRKST